MIKIHNEAIIDVKRLLDFFIWLFTVLKIDSNSFFAKLGQFFQMGHPSSLLGLFQQNQ